MADRNQIVISLNNALKLANEAMKEREEALKAVKHACGVSSIFDIEDLKIYREAKALDNQIDLLDDLISRVKRSLDEFNEFWEAF